MANEVCHKMTKVDSFIHSFIISVYPPDSQENVKASNLEKPSTS